MSTDIRVQIIIPKTMKKIFSLAVLLMAVAGFTSCDNDENEDVVLKDYALAVHLHLDAVDAENEDYQKEIEGLMDEALQAAGLENVGEYLYIQAADSANAAPQIKALAEKVEKVLDKSTCEMVGHFTIKAVEKALISKDDPKNSPWQVWYGKDYGHPAVGNLFVHDYGETRFGSYGGYYSYIHEKISYAMDIRLVGWIKSFFGSGSPDDFRDSYGKRWYIGQRNLNTDNGSKYHPYIAIQFAMADELNNYSYSPITDVIGVYMPGVPRDPVQVIEFESRYYYLVDMTDNDKKDGHTANLNRGNGGKDLYLYYTRDPYKGNYLTRENLSNPEGKQYSMVWSCGDCDDRKKFKNDYYREVHVYDYSNNMRDIDVMDTNWGAGGDWVGINFAYRDMVE